MDKISWKALQAEAKNGEPSAQYHVAEFLATGYRTEENRVLIRQNITAAFSWYEKAAMKGDIDATERLADLLSAGQGCDKDINRAIELYKVAIEEGSSMAALNLGATYRDQGNYKKAFEYYCLAAKMDGVDYSFQVGLCYYYGVGVPADKKTACRHFSDISISGIGSHSGYEVDEANYLLGLSYLTGEGVQKSIKKATDYLKLANTDNDHRSAQQLLFIINQY